MPFLCIHSSVMPEQKQTNFAVSVPLGWGTSHSNFEMNPLSNQGDMHLQSLLNVIYSYFSFQSSSFAHFRKIVGCPLVNFLEIEQTVR